MGRFRLPILLVASFVALPLLASAAAEVTLPVTGHVEGVGDLVYRTEIVVTNLRDEPQYVTMELIMNGEIRMFRSYLMEAHETKFLRDGGFGNTPMTRAGFVGAVRVAAVQTPSPGAPPDGEEPIYTHDPAGQIEANAFIVAERDRGARGATRQEVNGIPWTEYQIEEAMFLGVRNSEGTGAYTNVGIVNMHPAQTETFFVEFQYQEPVAVVVPPLSLRQIRIPGPGAGGRYVRVYPEWSVGDGPPVRTTPWVAYASTVDTQTGDAFSGLRVAAPRKSSIQ